MSGASLYLLQILLRPRSQSSWPSVPLSCILLTTMSKPTLHNYTLRRPRQLSLFVSPGEVFRHEFHPSRFNKITVARVASRKMMLHSASHPKKSGRLKGNLFLLRHGDIKTAKHLSISVYCQHIPRNKTASCSLSCEYFVGAHLYSV